MLTVERSNRTERLLEGLADRLRVPGRDPLAPAFVVVQGPGMERWLAQSIARRDGVCANLEFVFPRQLLDVIFGCLPERAAAPVNREWEPSRLAWWIAKRLEANRSEPAFAPLALHLDAVDGDWRLVQLSQQIAQLFDRYITFRPEWMRDWATASRSPADRDARWQAQLVRELTEELGSGHLADRAQAFLAAAHDAAGQQGPTALGEALARALPDRIEIFAVSTLPPLYLSVIDGLASLRDVSLSILSPTEGYWADLWREVRDGELEAGGRDVESGGLFAAAPATPTARLLAGLGRLGGDFQRTLEERVNPGRQEADLFESPLATQGAQPSVLARLQADLLTLDPAAGNDGAHGAAGKGSEPGPESESWVVRRDDDSIQVHFCHGPRRELEVVEAALRAAFERDATLRPEDVIVMAPAIDAIAPEIEAVFAVPHAAGGEIPHRIADRGAFQRSPVAETFRGLLALLDGRAARSEVFDWLSREPARERFGLDEEAVERLAEWAERAGVRFGLDEDHRADLGLEGSRAHSFRDGLERLALAHAVGAVGEVFEGLAPVSLDPFAEAASLGAIGDVVALLTDARQAIATPRSVTAWCAWLAKLLEAACVRSDANAHEHATVRRLLRELDEDARAAGYDRPIPFAAIRERVAALLEARPAPQAFLAGGVTFCELVPLRAIPFRVVVIMGLADAAFPRGGPAAGFDLMARAPLAGDRNPRIDDRYLFLEALLSARHQLILTVPGRDLRDGSDLPPSIVVTELLDALTETYRLEGPSGASEEAPKALRASLVRRHPLQSFSAAYFEQPGDPKLLGRDAEAFEAAQARRSALEAGGGVARRFVAGLEVREASPKLSLVGAAGAAGVEASQAGDGDGLRLTLDELVARVLRATRYFVRERLGLRVPRLEDAVDDLDPFALSPLERYALGAALLGDLEDGTDPVRASARLLGHASIPSGLPGRLAVRGLWEEAQALDRIARGHRGGEPIASFEAELPLEVEGLGRRLLSGHVDRLWPGGRICVGFGRVGGRSELDVWIRHLFLCAALEAGQVDRAGDFAPESLLIGRPASSREPARVVRFGPVEAPHVHLAALFSWAHWSEQTPLPFFPKASRDFAGLALEGKVDQAWRAAQQAYHGGDSSAFRTPEADEDLEQARLWEGVSPLEPVGDLPVHDRFDAVATAFFEPLLAARQAEVE